MDSMRAWRNQPANRAVSIHEHEIGAEEHAAWWARVQDDPTRRVLVFEHGDQPLGVVSFFDLELDGRRPARAPGASTSTTTVSPPPAPR